MKKSVALLLVLSLLSVLSACAREPSPETGSFEAVPTEAVTETAATSEDVTEEDAAEPKPLYELSSYNRDAYLTPYWEGNVVYHESVLPLSEEDGSIKPIPLLYEAKQIFSVRTADLKKEFREGTDYYLENGCLVIPEGSAIPTVSYSVMYFPTATSSSFPVNGKYGSGYLYFAEKDAFHQMQLAVTYYHEGSFEGEIPSYKGALLPKLGEKLTGQEPVNILLLGDSISVGANSSSFVNAEPQAPVWFDMVLEELREEFSEKEINGKNASVGGTRSAWGTTAVNGALGDFTPDLCILAFGMNDGTAKVSPEAFGANIEKMMAAVLKKNPDCQFLLISTMLPNPLASNFLGNQEDYLPVLKEMEKEGVAVVDMTTLHKALLNKKRYFDMTGNNVNHPNDFLARAYAQATLRTLLP